MAIMRETEAEEIFASLDAEYRRYKRAVEDAETPEQEEAAQREWETVKAQAFAARGYDIRETSISIDL